MEAVCRAVLDGSAHQWGGGMTARNLGGHPPEPTPFALADLLELVISTMGPKCAPGGWHGWTNDDLAARLNMTTSALKKMRYTRPMLTVLMADRLAIAAGYHPAEVWPHWWEEAA